jgi:hypothetical protein
MNIQQIIQDIDRILGTFRVDCAGLALRDKVLRLVQILHATRRLNKAVLHHAGVGATNARERIRLYMTRHVGIILDADELLVVSGISEYGRRVRELRVQDGYRILTGASNDPDAGICLSPRQYVLIRPEPDTEAAHRWHIANRIRRHKGAARDRILQYLQANVGKPLMAEELQYVARVKEYGRRTRELRTQLGFAVATCFSGRPDLRLGEYVLQTADRIAEPHDRNIPEAVERQVYARDANRCRVCQWSREMWTPRDPRFLEVHHSQEHQHHGPNDPANLLVVCDRCHDSIHADEIPSPTPAESDA